MNKKNLLLAVLFSSVFAIGGVVRSDFTKAVAGDYQEYSNIFYSFGSRSRYYNPSDDGFIFGYDNAENPYYLSFLIGAVDEEYDSLSKPYVYAFISFDSSEFLMFKDSFVLSNGYELTTQDFFNIEEMNISFALDKTYKRFIINLNGSRVVNSVLVPFSSSLSFSWFSPSESSTSSLAMPVTYNLGFSFKVFNNMLSSTFNDGYEAGKKDGFKDGEDKGYEDGYKEGVKNTELSSNLIGNVIFTTIGSIASFFVTLSTFEVLGISLGSIISLVVSVGLIVLVMGFLRK